MVLLNRGRRWVWYSVVRSCRGWRGTLLRGEWITQLLVMFPSAILHVHIFYNVLLASIDGMQVYNYVCDGRISQIVCRGGGGIKAHLLVAL